MKRISPWKASPLALALLSLACNGNVVVGSGGAGGEGGGSGGATTTTTTTSTTTPAGCQAHTDCPGGLCIFSSGLCSVPCTLFEPCPQGEVCGACATGSCPQCDDCVAACLPAQAGQCDDHDDCPATSVCLYGAQTCAPKCTDAGGCADPNLVCNDCATGSCPGCEDCVGACTESF